jgi:hypothetical protein
VLRGCPFRRLRGGGVGVLPSRRGHGEREHTDLGDGEGGTADSGARKGRQRGEQESLDLLERNAPLARRALQDVQRLLREQ